MKKRILSTLGWTVIIFVTVALCHYVDKNPNWLVDACVWTIPYVFGYFFGYGSAQKDRS